MAELEDTHWNHWSNFNFRFAQDMREALTEAGIKLSDNQANAAKHAAVSAIQADVFGWPTASVMGHSRLQTHMRLARIDNAEAVQAEAAPDTASENVAGAVAAAQSTNSVDIMMGVGGTPEGVVTACAMKCLGGEIQGMLAPQDDREREKVLAAGHDLDRVLGINDLVTSDNCYFAATGVTNGDMLRGVTYRKSGATTRSLVMRSKSGTVRFVESQHQLAKLQDYSVVDYSDPND